MGMGLLMLGLLAPTQVDVEVRNGATSAPIQQAEVLMQDSDGVTLQHHATRANGRAHFENVDCSEDIKFFARLRDQPLYPNPSAPSVCRVPVVMLKIRPSTP